MQGFSLLPKGAASTGITVQLWVGVSGVTVSSVLGGWSSPEALCSHPQNRDGAQPVVGLLGLSGVDNWAHSTHSAGVTCHPQSSGEHAGFPARGDVPGLGSAGVTQGSERVLNIQTDPRASPKPVPSVASVSAIAEKRCHFRCQPLAPDTRRLLLIMVITTMEMF